MTRDVKSIAGLVAACMAFILLVVVAGIVTRPPAPLTAVEERLVGDWNHVDLPREDLLSDMTFTADRVFHSNDGQFVGRWSIITGRLHITYWNDDWRENWSNWRPHRLWSALRWNDEVTFNIHFDGDGERVELAEPGEQPSSVLIRLQ